METEQELGRVPQAEPGSRPSDGAVASPSPPIGFDPSREIPNPTRWYFHADRESESWHRGGETREDAIDKGIAEYDGEAFWITKAQDMVPSFALFDADDICERLNEDECWWEDGWTGQPGLAPLRELERRLEATLKAWFAEFATLDGACLDPILEEEITASAIEARRAETAQTGSVHESAIGAAETPNSCNSSTKG